MSETEQRAGLELLLREPEIVAWLDDYRAETPESEEDDEPPRAA
jgi:hypothetical protein